MLVKFGGSVNHERTSLWLLCLLIACLGWWPSAHADQKSVERVEAQSSVSSVRAPIDYCHKAYEVMTHYAAALEFDDDLHSKTSKSVLLRSFAQDLQPGLADALSIVYASVHGDRLSSMANRYGDRSLSAPVAITWVALDSEAINSIGQIPGFEAPAYDFHTQLEIDPGIQIIMVGQAERLTSIAISPGDTAANQWGLLADVATLLSFANGHENRAKVGRYIAAYWAIAWYSCHDWFQFSIPLMDRFLVKPDIG